jgi:hypothetical protein
MKNGFNGEVRGRPVNIGAKRIRARTRGMKSEARAWRVRGTREKNFFCARIAKMFLRGAQEDARERWKMDAREAMGERESVRAMRDRCAMRCVPEERCGVNDERCCVRDERRVGHDARDDGKATREEVCVMRDARCGVAVLWGAVRARREQTRGADAIASAHCARGEGR